METEVLCEILQTLEVGCDSRIARPKVWFCSRPFPQTRSSGVGGGGGVVETTTPVRNDRDRNESIGGDDVNERDGMGGMELRGRKKISETDDIQ